MGIGSSCDSLSLIKALYFLQGSFKGYLFENPFLDASGNPVTATVPTTVETVVVTDASGSTVTGNL